MAHGHETLTEIVGTAGRLAVGQNPRINRVEISDGTAFGTNARRRSTSASPTPSCTKRRPSSTSCASDRPPPLTLADATEATRIGIAVTESLRSRKMVEL